MRNSKEASLVSRLSVAKQLLTAVKVLADHNPLMDPEFDEADVASAIYWFTSNNYNGQGSKMYEQLSRISKVYHPGPMENSAKDSAQMLVEELSAMGDVAAEHAMEEALQKLGC